MPLFLFTGGSAGSALRHRQRYGAVDTGPAGRGRGRGAADGKPFSRPLGPTSWPAAAASITFVPIVLRVRQAGHALSLSSVRGTEVEQEPSRETKRDIYLARGCFRATPNYSAGFLSVFSVWARDCFGHARRRRRLLSFVRGL